MSLAGATGLIGTAVGLAVLVGVAGLAFQAVERTLPDSRGRRKSGKRRQQDNIFDLGLTQEPRRSSKKKFRNENFGSDFNIFEI